MQTSLQQRLARGVPRCGLGRGIGRRFDASRPASHGPARRRGVWRRAAGPCRAAASPGSAGAGSATGAHTVSKTTAHCSFWQALQLAQRTACAAHRPAHRPAHPCGAGCGRVWAVAHVRAGSPSLHLQLCSERWPQSHSAAQPPPGCRPVPRREAAGQSDHPRPLPGG